MALPNNTLDQYFTHSSHCRVGLCAACVYGYDFSCATAWAIWG